MPVESRPDQPPDDRPVGSTGPPHPAPGREMARSIEEPDSVDPHRPIPEGEPGQAGAPGGEPVAPPGEESGGRPVPPPGTAEGGAPQGPPASHEQPPR
jgi:hypothetical protein